MLECSYIGFFIFLVCVWFLALLLNPFRSGQNNRNISYRDANQNDNTTRFTSGLILASFRSFQPFWQISVNFGRYQFLEEKKKKKKEKIPKLTNSSAQHVITCVEHLKNKPNHRKDRPIFFFFFFFFLFFLFASSQTLPVCLFLFSFFLVLCQVFALVCLLDFQFANPIHVTKLWK